MPARSVAHLREDGLYDVGMTTDDNGRASSTWFVASDADLAARGLKLSRTLTEVDDECELEPA